MTHTKSIICFGLVASLTIMIFRGTVSGASVTVQRETAVQNGQESVVVKSDTTAGGSEITFAPRRLKSKTDSGAESVGDRSVRRERFKPYEEGQGDRKMK